MVMNRPMLGNTTELKIQHDSDVLPCHALDTCMDTDPMLRP